MSDRVLQQLKSKLNKEYIDKFPVNDLENLQYIPLSVQNDNIYIGIVDTLDKVRLSEIVNKVESSVHLKPTPINLTMDQFKELIVDYKAHIEAEVHKLTSQPKDHNFNPNAPKKKRLGEQLVDAGLITNEQLVEALNESKAKGQPIGSILVSTGRITLEQLRNALSEQQGVESLETLQLKINEELMKIIPEDFMTTHKVIPVSSDGKIIKIGMVNPQDRVALNNIIYMTGLKPEPMLITHIEFERFTESLFGRSKETEKMIEAISLEDDDSDLEVAGTLWQQIEREIQNDASTVAKFANQIIIDAINKKASDIHIEPRKDNYVVRFRIDGILKQVITIPEKIETSLISRFKVMSRMNIAESRRPQDGTFAVKCNDMTYDLRINTLPAGMKEKMVLRILQPGLNAKDVNKEIKLQGASSGDLQKINNMVKSPHGVILVSGPTGSGKTTTLYSILNKLNDEMVNITTIEDPVEIKLDGINQVQVNPKADVTFASCMRAILRQDPDIIMIGEIRDHETLEIAIKAALTGHLVMSTIHTNSAVETITRMVDMGAASFLVSASLVGVVAQRLARKLCPECKKPHEVTDEELEQILANKEQFEEFKKGKIYKAGGCSMCQNSGYVGRLGLYEILPISREIKKLIAEESSIIEIEEVAISSGMKTLAQSCLDHIMNGETSIAEFIRVLGVINE